MRSWILAFLCCVAAYAQTTIGYITSNGVALRAQPASYYERLALLSKETPVEIVSYQGMNGDQWAEIRLPVKVTGWVHADSVNAEGIVVATPCPIYTGPGDHFTAFYMAKEGTTLPLEGKRDGDWACVAVPKDATAWVSCAFVALGQVPVAPVVVPATLPAGNSDAQRTQLQAQQAQQEKELAQDQSRLQELQRQSDALKAEANQREAELARLQNEAARLEAERVAAQAKASQVAQENAKALQAEQAELARLEAAQKAAQAKARLVQEDSARWEAEAKAMEEQLAAAREEAQRRSAAAKAEADTMAAEQQKAEELAQAALAKVKDAQALQDSSLKELASMQANIEATQVAIKAATAQDELLRAEQERMEASAKEQQEKLDAMRAESERLSAEQRAEEAKAEQARQERARVQAELEELEAETKAMTARKAELQAELPSPAPTSTPGKPQVVVKEISGVIKPLREVNPDTTHALCHVENGRYVTDFYLRSDRLDLKRWEGREVARITGMEINRGWDKPLFVVTGIVFK